MKIIDDWFTKTMLANTVYRNDKLRSEVGTTSEDDHLFSKVLNQLLMEKDLQSSIKTPFKSYVPDMFSTMNPPLFDQTIKANTKEPLSFDSINPEKINKVLDGKLTGMGGVFVQAGEKYNISPALLAAIAQHETGNGKSRAAFEKNNIAGMMGPNGLKSYATVEASIMDMARNLSKNYLGKGFDSIAKIGAKYAPIGAENDPTALNNHWVSGVSKFISQIKV